MVPKWRDYTISWILGITGHETCIDSSVPKCRTLSRMCDSFLITGHTPVKCSYTQSLPTSTANKDIRLFEYSS